MGMHSKKRFADKNVDAAAKEGRLRINEHQFALLAWRQ